MKSKPEQSRDRLREAGLFPMQVWVFKKDKAAQQRVKSEDKRAEVRKAMRK